MFNVVNKLRLKIFGIVLLGLLSALFVGYDYPTVPWTFATKEIISSSKTNANNAALRNGMSDGTKKSNFAEILIGGVQTIPDTRVFYGKNELHVPSTAYPTLQSAITAATTGSSSSWNIVIDSACNSTATASIPSNVRQITFRPEGYLNITGTLTFTGQYIETGPNYIFQTGTVTGNIANDVVYPEWFGAIADDSIDDGSYIQKAINIGKNVIFNIGVYRSSIELLLKTENQKLLGNGMGSGLETGVLDYRDKTTILFTGTGNPTIKTRVLYRGSGSDPEDDPISTAINIQAGNVEIKDLCVRLNFTGSTVASNNYGDDWDIGIFNGCRPHTKLENVAVIGYWRKASIYLDNTHATNLPHYYSYPTAAIDHGSDGIRFTNVETMGGLWGLYIQGPKLKTGETSPSPSIQYYDEVSGQLYDDYRGSFGFSDLTVYGSSIYGPEHHTKYRRADFTDDVQTDLVGGGAMYIDGACPNDVGRIRGHHFLNTRFSTRSAIMVYLGKTRRDQFIGCFWDVNGDFYKTDGTHVTTRSIGGDYYGSICDSTDRQMTKLMASSNSPVSTYFHYGAQDVMVGNDTGDGINIGDSAFKMGRTDTRFLDTRYVNKATTASVTDGFTFAVNAGVTSNEFQMNVRPYFKKVYLSMRDSDDVLSDYLDFQNFPTSAYIRAGGTKSLIAQGSAFGVYDNSFNQLLYVFGSGNVTLPLGGIALSTAGKGVTFKSTAGNSHTLGITSSGLIDKGSSVYDFDFLGDIANSNNFIGEAIDSGEANPTTGIYLHPGINVLKSNANPNSGYTFGTKEKSILLTGNDKCTAIIKIPSTVYNSLIRFGFHDTKTSTAPVNGAYIEIDQTTLYGKTVSGSAESVVTYNIALNSNTWYRIVVELNSTATLVTYTLYPDNSTTALWSDTLDTNIPIRTGQELACAITATSAISGVDICWLDYISFKLPKERVID